MTCHVVVSGRGLALWHPWRKEGFRCSMCASEIQSVACILGTKCRKVVEWCQSKQGSLGDDHWPNSHIYPHSKLNGSSFQSQRSELSQKLRLRCAAMTSMMGNLPYDLSVWTRIPFCKPYSYETSSPLAVCLRWIYLNRLLAGEGKISNMVNLN